MTIKMYSLLILIIESSSYKNDIYIFIVFSLYYNVIDRSGVIYVIDTYLKVQKMNISSIVFNCWWYVCIERIYIYWLTISIDRNDWHILLLYYIIYVKLNDFFVIFSAWWFFTMTKNVFPYWARRMIKNKYKNEKGSPCCPFY